MLAGAAVVATRGGAHSELIDARTGLLVDRGSAAALASAINELLEDPTRRARLARAGQARASSRFTWDRAAQTLLRALEEFAVARGNEWLYLDTKDDLHDAIRFYERNGYMRCQRYNDNPQATIFMRKRIGVNTHTLPR